MPSRRRSIWTGTLTLTGAAMISRGLGMVYRVLLARFLGAEGLGLYQMLFPFFIAVVTLSVAGTPVAISQIVADDDKDPGPWLRAAEYIILAVSLPVIAILLLAARPIAVQLYHDPRLAPLFALLSPALLAIAFSAVLRGFLLGRQHMEIPSIAQVVEQMVRVLILWALLNWSANHLVSHRLGIATVLISIGEGVSLLILARGFHRWRRRESALGTLQASPGHIRAILKLSLPIMFSRLLGSLVGVAEAALIPRQLHHFGLSEVSAVAFFGKLTGMALPLILFPTALTVSLSTNLIPAVAGADARHDHHRVAQLIGQSLSATAYLTVPVTVIMLLMGTALDDWIFHTQLPPTVFIPLALGAFFLYFDIALSGVLRGLGRTDLPLKNDLIASAVEVAIILGLGSPATVSAALAAGFFTSWWLNAAATERLTGIRLHWMKIWRKPAIATAPLLLAVPLWQHWVLIQHFSRAFNLASGLCLASGLYLVALRMVGFRWSRLI